MSNALVATQAATQFLAASSGPSINVQGVVAWLVKYIVPIILAVIGIGIMANAKKGRLSDNMSTMTNVFLGLVVIAGGGLFYVFATGLVHLVLA